MLSINSVLEWPGEKTPKLMRVLKLGKKHSVVIDMLSKKGFPVAKLTADLEEDVLNGQALVKEMVFDFMKVSEEEIGEKSKDRREQAMRVVEYLTRNEDIFDPRKRGPLVLEAMKRFKITKPTANKYLRQFWQGGMNPNALLPNFRGRDKAARKVKNKLGRPNGRTEKNPDAKGIIVTEDIERIFANGLALFYRGEGAKAFKAAYDEMLGRYFSSGYEERDGVMVPNLFPAHQCPSLAQFKYWYKKKMDPVQDKIRTIGEREYKLKERPVLGSTIEDTMGPGDCYQVDATITKEYLVSSHDRSLVIGQGVIYLVVDVYSRMPAGLYIGLEGPSWIGAMQALYNAYMDKVEFCKRFGINIQPWQWPAKGLPGRIIADRGEFASDSAVTNLITALGVQVENTASYRGDMKAVVESHFKKFEGARLPWSCPEISKANATKDLQKKKARLTMEDMYKIMIRSILNHNGRHMGHYKFDEQTAKAGVDPIPRELWKWGIKEKRGALRTLDDDFVKFNLLPHALGKVTRHGILFMRADYVCDTAMNEGWYDGLRGHKFRISYDPRDLSTVQLWEPKRKKFIECRLSERDQALRGLGENERKLYLHRKAIETRIAEEDINIPGDVEYQAHIKQIRKEAEKLTEEALRKNPMSSSARFANMRANRAVENQALRAKEAWVSKQDKQPSKEFPETHQVQSTHKEQQRREMLQNALA